MWELGLNTGRDVSRGLEATSGTLVTSAPPSDLCLTYLAHRPNSTPVIVAKRVELMALAFEWLTFSTVANREHILLHLAGRKSISSGRSRTVSEPRQK